MLHTKSTAESSHHGIWKHIKLCSLTSYPLHTLCISLLDRSEGGEVGRKLAQGKGN